MSNLELLPLLQLLIAAVLAGVLGLERQLADEPAGLRTHALVGMGAAVFGLLTVYGVGFRILSPPPVPQLAANIATGVGFLGAGAILRTTTGTSWVRGLATAASLWLAASAGLAAAWGHYSLAVGATVIGLLVLRGARQFEVRGLRSFQRQQLEVIAVGDRGVETQPLIDALRQAGAAVRSVEMEEVDGTRTFTLRAEAHPKVDADRVIADLRLLVRVTRVTQTA